MKHPYFRIVVDQFVLIVPVAFSKTWDFTRLRRELAVNKLNTTYVYQHGVCHASV
jgi:hypothetical protein